MGQGKRSLYFNSVIAATDKCLSVVDGERRDGCRYFLLINASEVYLFAVLLRCELETLGSHSVFSYYPCGVKYHIKHTEIPISNIHFPDRKSVV